MLSNTIMTYKLHKAHLEFSYGMIQIIFYCITKTELYNNYIYNNTHIHIIIYIYRPYFIVYKFNIFDTVRRNICVLKINFRIVEIV